MVKIHFMRKTLVILLSVATVALGVICSVQWRQLRQERTRHAALERALREETQTREEQVAKARELELRANRLQKDLQEFSAVTSNLRTSESMQRSNATALAERVKAVKNSAGQAGVSGKDMREMVSSMMKNPEMRKMIRGQQKAAVEMMYSGLFKQLQLAPEEKAELSELLIESQMRQVDGAQGLFGDSEGQDPAQARADFAQAKKETDAQVKDLLGEERYATYQDYQKNITERMQLDQLKTRLEGAQMPLEEAQLAQLLKLMKDEKAKVPPAIPTDPNLSPAETKALMTADNLDKQVQWMEDYNKRVLDGAAGLLTPDQLKQFREMQEQQASMQKMGLKMAKEMFGQQGGQTNP
jgi:phage terminase small subunit